MNRDAVSKIISDMEKVAKSYWNHPVHDDIMFLANELKRELGINDIEQSKGYNMKDALVKFMKVTGSWRDVADAARTTIHKEAGTGEPSKRWKKRILLCEHSPIRKLCFNWKWINLPYWVSVHFVRHKFGIEHWVSTQRSDRTGEDRTSKTQDAPVMHECMANAQAVMFISRRRLCNQASPETRSAWKAVVSEIAKIEPEVAECCVPECVYRGFCPEFKSCGYVDTPAFQEAVKRYRSVEE